MTSRTDASSSTIRILGASGEGLLSDTGRSGRMGWRRTRGYAVGENLAHAAGEPNGRRGLPAVRAERFEGDARRTVEDRRRNHLGGDGREEDPVAVVTGGEEEVLDGARPQERQLVGGVRSEAGPRL